MSTPTPVATTTGVDLGGDTVGGRTFAFRRVTNPGNNSEHYDIPTSKPALCVYLLLFIGFLVLVTTVPKSFTYVQYNEYALERDRYGDVQLEPTYDQGRYFRTLNLGFVKFPSTFQPVNFYSTVFADNGMEFVLHLKFYYRIPSENVGKVYDTYSMNYGLRVENNAKKVIKNVATSFSVNNYLSNRTYIESVIAYNVSEELNRVVFVDVPPEFVKIINIEFPDILIDTSLDSALALQQNELNLIRQSVELIRSETSEQVASINADKSLLLSNADNYATQLIETSRAHANSIVNTARSVGIGDFFEHLNITSTSDKEKILKAMAIFDNKINATLMYEITAGNIIKL